MSLWDLVSGRQKKWDEGLLLGRQMILSRIAAITSSQTYKSDPAKLREMYVFYECGAKWLTDNLAYELSVYKTSGLFDVASEWRAASVIAELYAAREIHLVVVGENCESVIQPKWRFMNSFFGGYVVGEACPFEQRWSDSWIEITGARTKDGRMRELRDAVGRACDEIWANMLCRNRTLAGELWFNAMLAVAAGTARVFSDPESVRAINLTIAPAVGGSHRLRKCCPECNSDVSGNAGFCHRCGAKLI